MVGQKWSSKVNIQLSERGFEVNKERTNLAMNAGQEEMSCKEPD